MTLLHFLSNLIFFAVWKIRRILGYGECLAVSVGTEEIPKYIGITARAPPLCGAQTSHPPGDLACVRVAGQRTSEQHKEPSPGNRANNSAEAQLIPRQSDSTAPVSLLLFQQLY